MRSAISEKIKAIVKDGLDPYLEKHGFAKRGISSYRSDGDGVQVVTIQSSRRNYADSGKFRVNFGVHFPEVAKVLHGSDTMPKTPSERYCVLRAIGTMPDRWWNVDSGTEAATVVSSLGAYWSEIIWPWLEANKRLPQAAMTMVKHNPMAAAAARLTLGEREEAVRLIKVFVSDFEKVVQDQTVDSPAARAIHAQLKSIRQWAAEHELL